MTLKDDILTDPENHTQPDSTSTSCILGLDATKEITLDGEKLPDAPARAKPKRR